MLYTGNGDDGKTKLFRDQGRVSKSSEVPEALGVLDELNAFLGFVKMRADKSDIVTILRETQENIFIVQAEVAGADKKIKKNEIERIEKLIEDMEKEIPPIKGFSIAGGTELSAIFDVARTLARKAERRLIAVNEKEIRKLSVETMTYMNRLSSLFFALARLINHRAGVAEESPHY